MSIHNICHSGLKRSLTFDVKKFLFLITEPQKSIWNSYRVWNSWMFSFVLKEGITVGCYPSIAISPDIAWTREEGHMFNLSGFGLSV